MLSRPIFKENLYADVYKPILYMNVGLQKIKFFVSL